MFKNDVIDGYKCMHCIIQNLKKMHRLHILSSRSKHGSMCRVDLFEGKLGGFFVVKV